MSAIAKPKIYILDVTNRDGVQTSRICLSKLEKTMINYLLNQMGFLNLNSASRLPIMKPII